MPEKVVRDAAAAFHHINATGTRDLVLVFDVVVYLGDDLNEQWNGIVDFYRKSLTYIQKSVHYFVVDGRAKFKPIDDETFAQLPFWASSKAGKRSIYGLTLHGGPTPDDAPEIMFDFYADRADPPYLRLVLPVDFADRPTLASDVITLVENVKLLCGSAGFAASTRRDFYTAAENGPVYALSRRFRAVDFGSPLAFSEYVREGLKSVNWMTLLGEELAERAELSGRLPKGVTAHKLKYGIALQAGERPIVGDTNRKESVAAYRAVNELVAESRFPVDIIEGDDEIGGEDNTAEWLTRFDD